MKKIKIKIARVVTAPFTFISLLGLLDRMSHDIRYEVHIISGYDEYIKFLKARYSNITFHDVDIHRNISLIKDAKALFKLYRIFTQEHFSIVHSHTPKAGLLSAIASFLAFVPIRIHTFTGQVWVNYSGVKRKFFKGIDWLICHLNSVSFADSLSQKKYLIENKVAGPDKIHVLLNGSFAGIDLKKFSLDRAWDSSRILREKLFPDFNGKIVLYLGRLNNDKGLSELHDAFYDLKKKYNLKLLVVGPEDKLSPKLENQINNFRNDSDVRVIGFVKNTEDYLAACDIFCLPSYREGCPTSVIEASAMGKPVVVSNIYGTSDLIKDGVTGLAFQVRNSKDLTAKLEALIQDNELREKLGKNGIEFVRENFSQELLTDAMISEYEHYFSALKRS